jgi:hypothetical protein
VLDPSLIPISVDVMMGDDVYELHFKVEPEEMHENPKPLEMDGDSNDLDRMDDRDVGHDEQRDFMQEDSEGNSKDKGTNMGFSNSHIEQRGGNKIIALMKNIVGSQGGDKDMETIMWVTCWRTLVLITDMKRSSMRLMVKPLFMI